MAIETPMGSTNIASRDYKNPGTEALAKALGSLATTTAQGASKGVNEDSEAKLKALLQGQQTAKDVQTATDLSDQNGGRSVRVGDTSIGVDPMAQMAKTTQKNNINAVTSLQKTYNSGTKGLQDTLDAAQNGLSALQSNDASTLGQVRAAMLKASGLNRFNNEEALANAPDSAKSEVAALMNKYGLDTPGGNLSDIQRQNAAKFFNSKVSEINDRHNVLKQQALGQYAQNPGSDPSRLSDLQATLGAPLDAQISSIGKKLQAFQQQALPGAPTQGSNQQTPGLVQQAGSALAKFFGGGGNTAMAAPAPQPSVIQVQHSLAPGQAAAMQAPPAFDPDSFLKAQ